MRIDEVADQAVAHAKWAKRQRAREAGGDYDRAELPPLLIPFRGEDPVALLFLRQGGRDMLLHAAQLAAGGFSSDVLALVFETFVTSGEDEEIVGTNPVTGQKWEQDGMADVAANHQGREKGWVRDALMVYVVNRAGDHEVRSLPFQLSGRHVVWTSLGDGDDKVKPELRGIIAETLGSIMREPDIAQRANLAGIESAHFGLSPSQARHHLDCAVVKFIASPLCPVPMIVAVFADEPERERILRESLADLPGAVTPEIMRSSRARWN